MYWLDNLVSSLLWGALWLLFATEAYIVTVLVIDVIRERRSHRKP